MLKFTLDIFYRQCLPLFGLSLNPDFSQLALTGGLVLVVKTSVVSAVDQLFVPTPTVIVLELVVMDIQELNA